MRHDPISRWMTHTPHTIGATQPLEVASRLMHEHHIRHLPVLDRGTLVGIVTERDLTFVETLKGVDPEVTTVAEAMSPNPYRVAPDAPLGRVVREMAVHKYGAALVVDGGQVAGVFTTIDALRVLAQLFAEGRGRPSRRPRLPGRPD